jgi:uncharacterized protein (DUF3084 family)
MDHRKTLDMKALSDNLMKKKAPIQMDPVQQAMWEIKNKLEALSEVIDFYADLERHAQDQYKNESLTNLFLPDRVLRINEDNFNSLLLVVKESTKFILEREIVLQKYQKSLDSKNLLENDPIFVKLSSMNSRIKNLESERDTLEKRNKKLEEDQLKISQLNDKISQLEFTVKEKNEEISV